MEKGLNLINLMERNVPTWKIILALSWPAIVEQLLQTVVNYVDTAMVGSVGVEATASVGITTSTLWLLNGLMNSVGVGYSVLMARRIGERRMEEAREVVRQAVLAIVVLGGILTLVMALWVAPNLPLWMGASREIVPLASAYLGILGWGYLFNVSLVVCSNILRCAGDTRTPMEFNLMTNVVNVAGNFMLIYPPVEVTFFGGTFTLWRADMGVAGAALATALATALSGTAMMWVLFCRRTSIQISVRDSFWPRRHIIREAMTLGVPVALERVTLSLGQLASTAMVTGLGTISIAAHQLALTGEAVCYMPPFGFSTACTAMVAQALGARDQKRAFSSAEWGIKLAVLVMVFCAAGMYVFSVPIIDFFTDDPTVIELGARMLRIVICSEPLFAIGVVIGGALRGAGDIRWPVYISVIGMLVVRIPLIYVLIHVFGLGLSAVWGSMVVDWVVRASLSLGRFYRRRWLTAWCR